jgi:hypothetical protein
VPFLAQSEDLCGGAVAAMVLRYWGLTDVQSEDFKSLVDRAKGGIAAGELTQAIVARGFVATSVDGDVDRVVWSLGLGRPVVALIDAGNGRLHYVVIVAWATGRVLFHDPAVGPHRMKTEAEFRGLWKASSGWAIVPTPIAGPTGATDRTAASPTADTSARKAPSPATAERPCDSLVGPAITIARGPEPEQASPALLAAIELCPTEPRAFAAMAGVKFRQKQWKEASGYAQKAADRDPKDADNQRLLATSLYLADRPDEALAAWNEVGEPRLDRVVIEGLNRTRQDVASKLIGLRPREVLTTDALDLARRRLDHLPTSSRSKVTYRPLPDGRADVVASWDEPGLIEPWRVLALRVGVEAAAKREGSVDFHSPTGRGESVSVGGRFAKHRPSMWASLQTPGLLGLPGVVTLGGLWDRQTYAAVISTSDGDVVETRRRGSFDWSHWVKTKVRAEAGVGIDRFHRADRNDTYASLRGAIETRFSKDRVALLNEATSWFSGDAGRGFQEFGTHLAFRSSVQPRRLGVTFRMDGRRATKEAPLAVWPGAGTGPGRPLLLRGSKLLRDGRVVGEAFGRGLLHATAELEMEAWSRGGARLGVAAFTDWAKPWDTRTTRGPSAGVFALGLGVRLRALGSAAVRVDVAKRPGRSGFVLSAGVIPSWPK